MEYKKFGSKYVVRLEKGEEIVESIKNFCEKEDIKLGTITGLGAINDLTVGLFNTENNEYNKQAFKQDFEIVSLLGNISTMEGEIYLHIHIAVGDSGYQVIGGHLNSGVVSATAELVIDTINGEMDREFSEEIGLNLYKF